MEGGFDLERFLHDKGSLLRSSGIHSYVWIHTHTGIQGLLPLEET